MYRTLRRITPAVLAAALLILGTAARAASQGPRERLETPEGEAIAGRLVGSASGFVFVPEGEGTPLPLERARAITFEGPRPDRALGIPPFRVMLGPNGRISGRLAGLDGKTIRLAEGPDGQPLTMARDGARALLQRPGEAQVFRDGFETLDESRWGSLVGMPELAMEPRLVGEHSLRLPVGGSALTAMLADPVGSGRLEVAFHDNGEVVPGQRWFVDLTFQNREAGQATIRAVLGWSEETLAVESPNGPRLAVQRLIRQPGWHRLTVRFGPDETELTVDGDELAHGPGLDGPLTEIRLATETTDRDGDARGLAASLDDLSLVRFAEPVGGLEVEPRLDEIRLVTGDQLFGQVTEADADQVAAEVDGRKVALPWSKVAALAFRRSPAGSEPIAGSWVRLEWSAVPGHDPRDLDRVEGALTAINDEALTLEVPFIGPLVVPRDRLRRLVPLGRARRAVIDPNAHHLGDRVTSDLDPPQPEPGPLTIPFELTEAPDGPSALALDAVQVIGEVGTPVYSELVKAGHLRTHIFLNDQPLDDLNRFISTPNETPERVRVPIPSGLLQKGRNVVRFEQNGTPEEPSKRDNLGLLGLAIETPLGPPPGASQP